MKQFKITGTVTIGFEKIVECESLEKADELADELDDSIECVMDIDDCNTNDWIEEVIIDDVEELEVD